MPWLILVQVKGAVDHPVYQVVASVRLKVPWASHGRQFTKNSVAPPLSPPIVSDPRAPCRIDDSTLSFERIDHDVYIDKAGPGPEGLGLLSE